MTVYGPQAQWDPYTGACGNGIRQDGKTPVQNDVTANAALFDENYQKEWVKYMVARYGRADQGGVSIWSLDNEPAAWPITHRDVHPLPQTYEETWGLSRTYAEAIKQADPAALVMSPAQPYWASMFYSSLDFAGAGITLADFASLPLAATYPKVPYWANPIDRNAHGGVDFTTWYLQKFRDYERQYGKRLLDYFDLHFAFMLAQPDRAHAKAARAANDRPSRRTSAPRSCPTLPSSCATSRTCWSPSASGSTALLPSRRRWRWCRLGGKSGPAHRLPRIRRRCWSSWWRA